LCSCSQIAAYCDRKIAWSNPKIANANPKLANSNPKIDGQDKEDQVPDIRHRVVISAPLEEVYGAVAMKEGLSEWWTRDGVRGDSSEGSRLQFFFGQPKPSAVMEVQRLSPSGGVTWSCVEGEDEWVGTKLRFDFTAKGGDTVVLFTHADWREPSEFMAHCSARWAYFLLSLKSLVETGKGTPFPDDLKF
jgi:uncharacterized protein YndB with AHSA1/START domain